MSLKKVVLFGNPPLLANFVGLKLLFRVVKSIANRIWGSLGLLEVLSSNNGFFIFSFNSVIHASAILDLHGTWPIDIWFFKDGHQTCNSLRLSCIEFLIGLNFIMFL